jgi:hypothetical protein
MKVITVILLTLLVSCNNGNNKIIKTNNRNIKDTISCEQNQNLVSVSYFLNNERIEYLPKEKKIRAIFTFRNNFKNILNKGVFNLSNNNDTNSSIEKISNNEFDIFINPNVNSENFIYWMILTAENTIFEWNYKVDNKDFYEYSDTWNVLKSHPIQK